MLWFFSVMDEKQHWVKLQKLQKSRLRVTKMIRLERKNPKYKNLGKKPTAETNYNTLKPTKNRSNEFSRLEDLEWPFFFNWTEMVSKVLKNVKRKQCCWLWENSSGEFYKRTRNFEKTSGFEKKMWSWWNKQWIFKRLLSYFTTFPCQNIQWM